MARKYKATIYTPAGSRKCMQVIVERDRRRKPLVSRFGEIPLRRVRTTVLTDQRPVMASTRRNELIRRLLAGRCEICEICEDTAHLEVHHVRKLADLAKPGRRDKPAWMHLMAKRRRKTLITCRRCREDIHLASAVRSRLGVRICHLNCEDSADPGTSRVYLEDASPQVRTLQRNRGQPESSWPDRHKSPHTAPRPRFAGHFAGPVACRAGGRTVVGAT
jgi:hypothetical protein